MNGIDTIKTELETVVGIFPSIASFAFGQPSLINDNRSQPFLLLNRQRTTGSNKAMLTSGMPKRRSYNLRLILSDNYTESRKETVDLSEKFEELEEILAQYIAKVYRRGINNDSNLIIPDEYEIEFTERSSIDNLITVSCDIVCHLFVGNCDTGTFTDVNAPTLLTATTSGSNIDLEWVDNSDNEDGFEIHVSDSFSGAYTLLAINTAGDNTYTVTAPTQDVTHFYKVRAYDGTLYSAWSNIAVGYVSSGGVSEFDYNIIIDGVDTGQDVTVDGSEITINVN
jgi:hypothetical protein